MKKEIFIRFFVLLLFSSLLLTSCEQKKEETEQPAADTVMTETPAGDTVAIETSDIVSLEGTWKGTLGGRASTFKITEFQDNQIKGTITTLSRETYTQQVSGIYVPETRAIRLTDQVHSKFMGKYTAALSEDANTMTGTFTRNSDGNTSKFDYKREQ